jgi:hypothetical protein
MKNWKLTTGMTILLFSVSIQATSLGRQAISLLTETQANTHVSVLNGQLTADVRILPPYSLQARTTAKS